MSTTNFTPVASHNESTYGWAGFSWGVATTGLPKRSPSARLVSESHTTHRMTSGPE